MKIKTTPRNFLVVAIVSCEENPMIQNSHFFLESDRIEVEPETLSVWNEMLEEEKQNKSKWEKDRGT